MSKRAVLLLMFLTPLLQSCDRGRDFVSTSPSMKEIAGRYRLTSTQFGDRVDSKLRSEAKDAYIELTTNGVVTLHRMPVVLEGSGGGFYIQEVRSDTGAFTIAALGGTSKREFYGIYLECGNLPRPVEHAYLKRVGRALFLSFRYFDGDFIERMLFTRVPP